MSDDSNNGGSDNDDDDESDESDIPTIPSGYWSLNQDHRFVHSLIAVCKAEGGYIDGNISYYGGLLTNEEYNDPDRICDNYDALKKLKSLPRVQFHVVCTRMAEIEWRYSKDETVSDYRRLAE
jgi:hypothetical protein